MMQCPLCGGPLHVEEDLVFACERGHVMAGDELQRSASERVTVAFWMAIEALESEGQALRTLAEGDGGLIGLAEQAEDDARVLRRLAARHLPPGVVREDDRA